MNYEGLKFGATTVKFIFNHYKTDCNATNFLSRSKNLLGGLNCNLFQADLYKKIIGYNSFSFSKTNFKYMCVCYKHCFIGRRGHIRQRSQSSKMVPAGINSISPVNLLREYHHLKKLLYSNILRDGFILDARE